MGDSENMTTPAELIAEMLAATQGVVRQAWELCENTETLPQARPGTGAHIVRGQDWEALADALSALEALIPEAEQPASAGHCVTLCTAALAEAEAQNARLREALANAVALWSYRSTDAPQQQWLADALEALERRP